MMKQKPHSRKKSSSIRQARFHTTAWVERTGGSIYDDAIAQFQKQISATSAGYDAYADLGILLCHRKRCREAMPALERPRKSRPNIA